MNRYDIKNKASGLITHSYDAEAPMALQTEWGQPEHEEPVYNEDGTQKLDADGSPVLQTVPATYDIVVTDISFEYTLAQCWLKRAAEYPPIGEFADAMVHAQMGDNSKLTAYYAACEAVKAKYPKPNQT